MSGQLHDTIMLYFFLSEDRKPAGKFWFIEGFVLWSESLGCLHQIL